MQDFNNVVFFALVLNILTSHRAPFSAFCLAETFTAAEALKFKQCVVGYSKNKYATEIRFKQLVALDRSLAFATAPSHCGQRKKQSCNYDTTITHKILY